MSAKFYTVEDLAQMTDMPDLPGFIRKRTEGRLAISTNLLGLEKPLEDFITHKPSPSRAEIEFDEDDNLTLRSIYQGIGWDVSFLESEDGKFEPVKCRVIIENGHPMLWAVGEYDIRNGTTSYYKSNALAAILPQMVIKPDKVGTLKLSYDDLDFSLRIQGAATQEVRQKLADELLAERYSSIPRSERRFIAEILASEDLDNAEDRQSLSAYFTELATTPRSAPASNAHVQENLKAYLEKLIEPIRIFESDQVKYICRQVQHIRNLQAHEILGKVEIIVEALKGDDRQKLGRIACALDGPNMLHDMVLKGERAAPQP